LAAVHCIKVAAVVAVELALAARAVVQLVAQVERVTVQAQQQLQIQLRVAVVLVATQALAALAEAQSYM
jgi:hypothetical protein